MWGGTRHWVRVKTYEGLSALTRGAMAGPRTFKINFMGDTMLGRLIDQFYPSHVHEPEEAKIVESLKSAHPHLQNYKPESPWGTALPQLLKADLNILNLETSATTCRIKWPNKTFNYRMHPENINALKAARIDYAGLANNHTLDFSEIGLLDTVKTVKGADIAFAGAGSNSDEARTPAILTLPRSSDASDSSHKIQIWAASDHPSDWAEIPLFHHIDYSTQTRTRLKAMLTQQPAAPTPAPALKVFSVHWGPNYAWTPAAAIQSLAHFLVDECGVDIVHGHSSHHVQGVEAYHGALIIYGCGDFVDDYALVPEFRNDLSAVWRVCVREEEGGALKLDRLEVLPTKIKSFQTLLLSKQNPDHEWTVSKIRSLSSAFGTVPRAELGDEGQLIFDL